MVASEKCSFIRIKAPDSDDNNDDGAIFNVVQRHVKFTFKQCCINDCWADDRGGAFYLDRPGDNPPIFEHVSISKCVSDNRVIYIDGDKQSTMEFKYFNIS